MIDYIKYLKQNPQYKKFAVELENAGGSEAAKIKDPTFANKWKELANDPEFVDSQTNFIIHKKVQPTLNNIKDIQGLNLEYRHPVVKDVVVSAAVQHGNYGAPKLLHRALGYNVQQLSDKNIIEKIYNERAKVDIYFQSSLAHEKESIRNRFQNECKQAVGLLYR